VARAAVTLVGHHYFRKLLGLVYGLVALDTQKVGRPFYLVIDFLPWANIPFVIRVAELANLREVRRFRTADFVALLAVVHVRKVLTSTGVGPCAVALKARGMSLFDRQFILAGVGLPDPLMTVGAPGGLSRGQPGRWKLRRSRCDWLEFETLGERFPVLHVRKVYAEIASEERVEPVGPFFEVEQAGGRL